MWTAQSGEHIGEFFLVEFAGSCVLSSKATYPQLLLFTKFYSVSRLEIGLEFLMLKIKRT
jgi:hypothetical protein